MSSIDKLFWPSPMAQKYHAVTD